MKKKFFFLTSKNQLNNSLNEKKKEITEAKIGILGPLLLMKEKKRSRE